MSTNNAAPGGGVPPTDAFARRRQAKRRASRNGNSTWVSIPLEFMSRLNILPGCDVVLTLYEEHGGFFVKPIPPTGITSPGRF